jgi:hypothetical protein
MTSVPISVSLAHEEVPCLVLKRDLTHSLVNCPSGQKYRELVESAHRNCRVVILTVFEKGDMEPHVLLLPWEELQLPDIHDSVSFTGRIIQAGGLLRVEGHFKDEKGELRFVK